MSHPSLRGAREVDRINAFFPILSKLGNRWAASRPWEGRVIGLHLHLNTMAAALVRDAMLGGGQWLIAAKNPASTDPDAVALLRELGVEVFTDGDIHERSRALLSREPSLIAEDGNRLIQASNTWGVPLEAAVEISRDGIEVLRAGPELSFPVVNILDGRLRNAVDNRHGVGEGVWRAVGSLTGMHLAGRRVAIIGYGSVGRGLANYARAANLSVEVIETDPVRRLFAHYDGFPTADLLPGVARARLVVTATGTPNALPMEVLEHARDGVILLNAGHRSDEIDIIGLEEHAITADHVSDKVVRYHLQNTKQVTVLGHGHPLNIVADSGSPEPVLLHYAVLGLTLEWLARFGGLPAGEQLVPDEIETRASILALESLNPVLV